MSQSSTEIVQAAARVLVNSVLDLIQVDPHSWSERPCPTCRSIGAIIGRDFGCYVYARQRETKRGGNI